MFNPKFGMTKLLQYRSMDDRGEPGSDIIYPRETITKLASLKMLPEMAEYWKTQVPDSDKYLYLLVNIMGASEWWGCFPEGNMTITSEGIVKDVSEIDVGDRYTSHKNKPGIVKEKFSRDYSGDIYSINAAGVPEITCTPNHRFWTVRKGSLACKKDKHKRCTPETLQSCSRCESCNVYSFDMTPAWRRADELSKNDMLLVPRYRPKRLSTPIHIDYARLIGLYLAEGSIAKTKGVPSGIELDFHEDETEFVEEVFAIAKRMGISHGVYPQQNSRSVRVFLYSSTFAKQMEEWVGSGASGKRISPEIFTQRDSFIKDVIGGYLDGDGSVAKNGYAIIGSVSKVLLLQIKQLLFRLGCNSSWFWNDDPKQTNMSKNRLPWGQIGIRYNDLLELKGHSLKVDNCRWVPKAKGDSKSFATDDFYCIPIRGISKTHRQCKVYNCEAGSDHSYTVSYVSVHNSNLNGDGFSEEALKKYHKTFMQGHSYLLHDNDDVKKSFGKIIFASYNDNMHRVENICRLLRSDGRTQKIESEMKRGLFPEVSMGCHVPADFCSICNNMARTKSEYCEHVTENMRQLWPIGDSDGRRVVVWNRDPTFFDNSFVAVPADDQSGVLAKIASRDSLPYVLLSVDAAVGNVKKDAAQKLSKDKAADMEKPLDPTDERYKLMPHVEYDEDARIAAVELDEMDNPIKESMLERLAHYQPREVVHTAALMGISVRPEEFGYLKAKEAGLTEFGISLLSRRVNRVKMAASSDICSKLAFNTEVAKILEPMIQDRSYFPSSFDKRAGKDVGSDRASMPAQWMDDYAEVVKEAMAVLANDPSLFYKTAWVNVFIKTACKGTYCSDEAWEGAPRKEASVVIEMLNGAFKIEK